MASQEGTSLDQTVDPGIDTRLETRSIAGTLTRLENCSKLIELLRNADLLYVLERSGLQTLFAPNDQALENASPSDPEAFLNNHLLRGEFKTFDLRPMKQVKSAGGQVIPIETRDGQQRIGPAGIVKSDIPCTNGVIHVIDHVL